MSTPAHGALNKGTQSKTKRSFISRLPSFRKKKTPPVASDLDMHIRSAQEDLNGGVKVRPPNQVKNRREDDVKRRSKTSSIVASYEKRLSDLKDEEIRTNGKKNKGSKSATLGHHGNGKTPQQDGVPHTNKSSRFGFGFTWQKITSFENSTTNGKNNDFGCEKSSGDKLNANVPQERIVGSTIKSHSLELHLPHGSPPDREATSSVRTPDSDRSSVSSNSSAKVYGLPMPYRSVFSDEPRGIKRQASSSQSEGFNSSGISMSRSTSPLHDNSSSAVETHHDCLESGSQLNSTVIKDNKDVCINSHVVNRTLPIEESPTCIVNRTFKLEPEEDCRISGKITQATATCKQDLASEVPELGRKEKPISCPTEPSSISSVGTDSYDVSGQSKAPSKAVDEAMPPEQDTSRPSSTTARNIPTEINSVSSCIKNSHPDTFHSPRHRQASGTMGGMQSVVDSYSTPARPMELAFQLRKPQISAVKHYSESLDSCELDSLCSEDLMCDSRYLDDEMFDAKEESSCLLNRSLSLQESAAIYRTQHCPTTSSRSRSVSVDQAQLQPTVGSLEKRVGVTRGLSPSPLSLPRGRRGGRNYAVQEELCQSPVEELQSLIYSASYRGDADRNKNANASCTRVQANSGANSHPLRPPRWPNLPLDEDGAVQLDTSVYRHMVQDITSVKTMLLKLKRSLQEVDSASSPFEHSLGLISPCSSLPTSPLTEANPMKEVIIEDLKEENTVLRKEVKNLQELLADTQHELKEAHIQIQTQKARPEKQHISTQCTSETRDQSQQVNLQPSGDEQQEKLSNMTSPNDSPLKVGHSPTAPEPPSSEPSSHMETSPTGSRRAGQHPQPNLTPPSPERAKANRTEMSKTLIASVSTKVNTVTNSHTPVTSQNSTSDYVKASAGQVSRSTPVSPSRKGVTASGTSQSPRVSRAKKQSSRSKLMQPVSYKSKIPGSQDSLLSKGAQPDDESQATDDRRGGLMKRQLASSQAAKGSGIPHKTQGGSQSELQQKPMQEAKGCIDGVPKQKEIRMMPSQYQSGNNVSLPQREAQGQVQDIQSQVGQKENDSLLPKISSKSSTPKAALAAKPELQTSLRCDADKQLPLTDANSNPVSQQNGLPAKRSGLQQPQFVRKIEQSESTAARQKAGVNPNNPSTHRKQSPPALSRPCLSRSPDTESSDEERATPPSPTQFRGQEQQTGSRIAMPVRGRGVSKLPRGSGIPTRRTNNS